MEASSLGASLQLASSLRGLASCASRFIRRHERRVDLQLCLDTTIKEVSTMRTGTTSAQAIHPRSAHDLVQKLPLLDATEGFIV